MAYRIKIPIDNPNLFVAQVKQGYYWRNINYYNRNIKCEFNDVDDAKQAIIDYHIGLLKTLKIQSCVSKYKSKKINYVII